MTMKEKFIPFLIIFIFPFAVAAKSLTLVNAPAQVYLSPRGGCTKAIVDAINRAKSDVLIQAYSFTSPEIAKALVDAHRRGVNVEIILDKSNRSPKYSVADFAGHMGIPTFIDAKHAIAHDKVMIIDRNIVATGSFNFTRAAENNNAENLIIIQSKDLADIYLANWYKHQRHSTMYKGR
jgi:phosphatidylserine/phosphatidylglycerophosphate/cardiolipin synthase-like enzyme